MFFRMRPLARSTSSWVGGSLAKPSTVFSRVCWAASMDWSGLSCTTEHLGHYFERSHIGVQGGRNVIGRHDALDVADPAQNNGALAFLSRLRRVRLGENALRAGDRA